MATLKAQGVRALVWNLLGNFSTRGLGFLVSLLLARLLDPSDFGLVALIMAMVGIASMFTDAGLGNALIQRNEVEPAQFSSVFWFNISVGLLLTIMSYFSAGWVGRMYDQSVLEPLIQALSLSFFIGAFGSVHTAKLRRELNYSVLARANFFSALIGGAVGLLMALAGQGVWSLVAQILSTAFCYNVFIWIFSRWKPGLSFSLGSLLELWSFGFRLFLAGLLDAVVSRLDFLVMGKLFLPATLGFYHRAKTLNAFVSEYPSSSLGSVLFPVLSKVQTELYRLQNIVRNGVGLLSFVTFFSLGCLYMVSEELVLILFGEKWLPSVPYLQILVLSGFRLPLGALFMNVLRSRGDSRSFLRLEVYKKIVLSTSLIVLYYHGIHAYLYSLVFVAVVNLSLNVLYVSRDIKMSVAELCLPMVIQAAIALASAFFAFAVTSGLTDEMLLNAAAKLTAFCLMYMLINWLARTQSYKAVIGQFFPGSGK